MPRAFERWLVERCRKNGGGGDHDELHQRPGCPAEERDGIAQPDQRSRQTSLERIGKIYGCADGHCVITSTSIESTRGATAPRASGMECFPARADGDDPAFWRERGVSENVPGRTTGGGGGLAPVRLSVSLSLCYPRKSLRSISGLD